MSAHDDKRTGQRDVQWPVIDPRVLRMGVSKIRMIDSEWLHQFAANGEIAVIQTADEPLSVLVPYTLYQTMQAQMVGYHDAVPLSEASPSTQSAAQESSSQNASNSSPETPHSVLDQIKALASQFHMSARDWEWQVVLLNHPTTKASQDIAGARAETWELAARCVANLLPALLASAPQHEENKDFTRHEPASAIAPPKLTHAPAEVPGSIRARVITASAADPMLTHEACIALAAAREALTIAKELQERADADSWRAMDAVLSALGDKK